MKPHGFGDNAEPMFFCPIKTLRDVYRKVCIKGYNYLFLLSIFFLILFVIYDNTSDIKP